MCDTLQKNLRYFVLKTNKYWPFEILYKAIYLLALKIFVLYLKRKPEIETIYLKGSLALGEWIPGASDIDLIIIIKDISIEDEVRFLNKFWTTMNFVSKFLPFFRNDAMILSAKELAEENFVQGYQKYFVGNSITKWKLLVGKELRTFKETYPVFDIPISWHFSYWYHEIFNHFYNQFYEKEYFLRPYYKMLLRILGPIYAYETGKIPDPNSTVFEHFQKKLEPYSYKLVQELKELKQKNYWSDNPVEAVPFYLYCTTKIVDAFYDQLFKNKYFETRKDFRTSTSKQEMESDSHNIDELKAFAENLFSQSNSPKSIISISSNTYLILKPDFEFCDFKLIINSVKEWFSKSSPLKKFPDIFTEKSFSGKLCFLGGSSMAEYHQVITQTQILFGQNIIEELKKPLYELVGKKFTELAFWYKYINVKWLFRSKAITDLEAWWFYELLDKRLIDEKCIVTSTPLQTKLEYIKNYGHEEETKWLIEPCSRKNLYCLTKHVLKKLGY